MEWLQLQEIPSLTSLLAVVAGKSRALSHGGWILGRGWDESRWPERRFPNRSDLDGVAGKTPVLIRRVDGHMSVVNTAALRVLRIPKTTLGLEIDARGRPTGILKEKAADLAGERTKPTVRQLLTSFPRMIRLAHSLGITSVHDVVDERGIEAYRRLRRSGELHLRVCMMPLIDLLPTLKPQRSASRDPWLRSGPLKAFSDGSLGAKTAALQSPYVDALGERGLLTYSCGELARAVRKAHRKGFQLAIHAIGDRAIDCVIDAFEEVLEEDARENHRHRIEHFELPTDEALERCEELGIIPVMQPNFVVNWSQPGGMYEARLGPRRTRRNNPHRLILKHGLSLAFGSDGMPYGPLFGLKGAVNPPYPSQRITLYEALEAYTLGGAFASFQEKETGSLTPGAFADFAVIDGDWNGDRYDLDRWRVVATIVGGEMVYKDAAMNRA